MGSFLGIRTTDDFVADQRPKNWREAILHLWPTGSAPLTAISAMMPSEKVDDPQFHWWTKKLPTQRGTVTGVYTDSALTSAYSSGGSSGDTLYFKMSADDAGHFRKGMEVVARYTGDLDLDVVGKVTNRSINGANSYIEVRLMEDDDNSGTYNLSDADVLMVLTSLNEEGASTPESLLYDPIKYYNYTYIARTSLKMTRTALRTRLRTGDQYKEAKREALELHSIMLEKAWLMSIPYEGVGENGYPERATAGLFYFGRTYVPENVLDFKKDHAGSTWLDKGDEWLDAALERWFRWGSDPLALAGSGAMLGIQKLAKASGTLMIEPSADIGYGFKVHGLVTSFGDVPLRVHPLMSIEPTLRNTIIIIAPKHLRYRYIDDTTFIGQKSDFGFDSEGKRVDARVEEFLTEAGLEYDFPDTIMILNNVGVDAT